MLSSRIVLIVTLASARILSAQSQTPTQPPLGVKRVPPAAPGQTTPKNLPPLLQQYDFGGQLRALDGSGLPSDAKPELLVPGGPTGTAPKDFRPKSDVPLTATALEAVRVSERWQGEKNAPLPGPDGRVMYSFGAGLPTVVCAPLRVCIIELQAERKRSSAMCCTSAIRSAGTFRPGDVWATGDQGNVGHHPQAAGRPGSTRIC